MSFKDDFLKSEYRKHQVRKYELKSMPYRAYLETQEWKQTRDKALRLSGNQCNRCGSTCNLQIHHQTYTRRGSEAVTDTVVLCAKCHELIHRN